LIIIVYCLADVPVRALFRAARERSSDSKPPCQSSINSVFSLNEVRLYQVGTPPCCRAVGWIPLSLKSSLTNDSRSHQFDILYQIKEL